MLSRGIAMAAVSLLPLCAAAGEVDVETVLKEWESVTSRIERVECSFVRFRYDMAFEIEHRAAGSLAVSRSGIAFYEVRPSAIRPGAVAKKHGRDGVAFQLRSDHAERWHWTGNSVLRVNETDRSFEEFAFGPAGDDHEFCPDPPPLPEDERADEDAATADTESCRASPANDGGVHRIWPATFGEAVVGLFVGIALSKVDWAAVAESFRESIREFWLARPFLLGMPAEELSARFKVTLLKQTDTEVFLEFESKQEKDPRFERAILILTKDKYEPRALKLVQAGRTETVHVFIDLKTDRFWNPCHNPFEKDRLKFPDMRGYRNATIRASAGP